LALQRLNAMNRFMYATGFAARSPVGMTAIALHAM
jgi:hypothetical protein